MNYWFLALAGIGLAGLACASDPPGKIIPEAERGEGLSLTVYNQDFVMVKERRLLDLKRGRMTFRFRDVAATIVPETVQFSTFQPGAARVVEQDYEFDLVSADKLLDKYIDRPVALVTGDGQVLKGVLLSFDPSQIVLKTDNGVDLVPRDRNIKDVQFSALPGGLLTKPTLVWQLDAKNDGKDLVKVTYRANQMNWHVDYRARLNQTSDRMDLAGWVTVTNGTGTTYKDAQVKLMAGDVHIVQEPKPYAPGGPLGRSTALRSAARVVTEKSFAEYHLYELGHNVTIKNQETKQIELLDLAAIPVARKYAYNGNGNRVAVVVTFKNEEKTAKGLGIPLPKGPMRIFQRDLDNQFEFAGTDELDHTAKDEQVSIRLGYATDLVGERRQLSGTNGINQSESTFEIHLRNHKTEAAKVDIVENINGHLHWSLIKHSHPYIQRNVNTLVFPVELQPNTEAVVTYTIRYNW